MRNLLIFMFLVAIFVVGFRNCHFSPSGWHLGPGVAGEGPIKSENRSPGEFKTVRFDISGDVELATGDTYNVEVMAQESILPVLKTEVKDGRLRVYFSENVWSSEDIKLRITAPTFEGFTLGGSGDVRATTPLRGENLDLDISGSGNLTIADLQYKRLDCGVSGSGNLTLGGYASEAELGVSGSGEVSAKNLNTERCKVDVSGAGNVECGVQQQLDAHVSGSGNVTYYGSPSVNSKVSGAGSVDQGR
jgi:hypothetical protein